MASASVARKRGSYAKSNATRERILEAAFAVAGEAGLHRASLSRIAARAGVAVGNVGYHFGSRDELLRALVDWLHAGLLGAVQTARDAGGSFLEVEEASLRAYLDFVHRNPAYVRLAEEVRHHHPDLYRERIARWLALLREGLEAAVRSGELRPLAEAEITALSHALLGTRYFLDQLIEGVDGSDYPGDDAVVEAHLGLLRRGLAQEAS